MVKRKTTKPKAEVARKEEPTQKKHKTESDSEEDEEADNFEIQPPCLAMFIGCPNQGKSFSMVYFLMAHLLKNTYDTGLVITNSKYNGAYDFLPDHMVKDRFDMDAIIELKEHQRKERTEAKEEGREPKKAFLVIDDCIGTAEWNCKEMTDLAAMFRQLDIAVFIATQYMKKIPVVFRECATHAFIFKQYAKSALDALYETYGQEFEKPNHFKSFLQKAVEERHTFLLFDKYNMEYPYSKGKVHKDLPFVFFNFKEPE